MSKANLANFVWTIADQLRGVYRPAQYGSVILPMTILRRLDCVLAPSKDDVRKLAAKNQNPDRLDLLVHQRFGLNFYNTSAYDFRTLLQDPKNLRSNLVDYLSKFSHTVADIFERFKFENEVATLDEKDRLYLVVQRFAEVDLHPDLVSNAEMGSLFEELIRKFAEASNETAGEHFTPRDAIRLMVEMLFAADDEALSTPGVVRSVYDPTAGTGGMLSVADEHLTEQNPDARLVLYGQEINDLSYAICKSDLIGKGQDTDNIQLGDTLRDDRFAGRSFDYCLSNPPYGVDWKSAEKDVKAEAARFGASGRFGHGLPSISDGQMLFLCHLASKIRPISEGGGRAGIVLNGSPLFNGRAGSGESEIRRWLLESDMVDAIVALPTNMFYNTGIATYIWLLDNNKPADRAGTVQLIDATSFWSKLRKNLGSKNREIGESDRAQIVKIYDAHAEGEHCKILPTSAFGYRTITVERPLRLSFALAPERIEAALSTKQVAKLGGDEQAALCEVLEGLNASGVDGKHRSQVMHHIKQRATAAGLKLAATVLKAVVDALGERDDNGAVCLDGNGKPVSDTALRDTENVPLDEDVRTYFEREVLPHVPNAWIDETKTKVGYEIPFTRLFYRYVRPRPLVEIDAELNRLAREIIELLGEVER